jgi:hypothetical protein
MRASTKLLPLLILAVSTPIAAQQKVPAPLAGLKPHQIVEAVAAEQQSLGLTAVQVHRLDSLHFAVKGERHRYDASPSLKAHQNIRMKPMISKRRAYGDALAILTPDQRTRAAARFDDPAYTLPEGLQAATAKVEQPAEPLQHHVAGAAPAGQATGGNSAEDPLEHHKGTGAPSERAVDSGQPAPNPETHK